MQNVGAIFSVCALVGAVATLQSTAFAQQTDDCTPVECYRLALEKLQAAEDRVKAAEEALKARTRDLDIKITQLKSEIHEELNPRFTSLSGDLSQTNQRSLDVSSKLNSITTGSGVHWIAGTAEKQPPSTSINCPKGSYLLGFTLHWSKNHYLQGVDAVCRKFVN